MSDQEILDRLQRIEDTVLQLAQRQAVKESYSTEEAAKILGKAEFTVREWARLGRINAAKKGSGRGKYQSWVISHAEILRYQRDGLLPAKN
jgi:transposase